MELIKLSDLHEMLKTAAMRVIENIEEIDRINVFPVADRDTGSNLTKTLASFRDSLDGKGANEAQLASALDAGLAASQGNSGLLIISYLNGLLKQLKDKKELNYSDFALAFKEGALAAKNSVDQPVYGTMLDVMEAFSDSFSMEKNHTLPLKKALKQALDSVRVSLVKTESKMKILDENDVVDAGALGFTFFIFGFCEKITDITLDMSNLKVNPIKIQPDLKNLGFPYEIIFILENPVVTGKELKDILHPYGDSLDIASIENKIKIHIHTNTPEALRETAHVLGEVTSIETFDMRIENPNHS